MNPLKNRHSECKLPSKYDGATLKKVGWGEMLRVRHKFEIGKEPLIVRDKTVSRAAQFQTAILAHRSLPDWQGGDFGMNEPRSALKVSRVSLTSRHKGGV
jgi:hypothetical protein